MSNRYSQNSWLQKRFNGNEGYLWLQARKMMLLSKPNASALDIVDQNSEKNYSNLNQDDLMRNKQKQVRWTENTDDSVRLMIDSIVTRWKPEYMNEKKRSFSQLHQSLISTPWKSVALKFDESHHLIDPFDDKQALEIYQNRFVPLHYHELWASVVNELNKVENTQGENVVRIKVQKAEDKETSDKTEKTALLIGTYASTLNDPVEVLNSRLLLFDLVLITIGQKSYFGVVVRVDISEISSGTTTNTLTSSNNFNLHLMTTMHIYVSYNCAHAFEQQKTARKSNLLEITRITNIGATRYMVNAIHNLKNWAQYRSLLNPTNDDLYFALPEEFDSKAVRPADELNWTQMKVVRIAESIFDDIHDRLHIVHGPPGTGKSRTIARTVLKLLPKLKRNEKLLLCAPSNKACDELLCRIIQESPKQDGPYKPGTIVRVGRRPPNEYKLSEYYADFMILEKLVKMLRGQPNLPNGEAQEIEKTIFDDGKIFISTLNYCGSFRMRRLVNKVRFIIIDEASQSLEADCLIPLRLGCRKLMLVGDPWQLRPTVLSKIGRKHRLDLSLYRRLYSTLNHNKNGPVTTLNTQYRMHSAICQFPSKIFYKNRLKTYKTVDKDMEHFPLEPLYFYDLPNSKQYVDHSQSFYNIDEINFVKQFCEMLATNISVWRSLIATDSEKSEANSISNATPILLNDHRSIAIQQRIAVITPYQAQLHCFRQQLPPCIELMTADSAQGSEKDIIIISCVRSSDDIGFLTDRSRLNVMLTRAKYGLYIAGNLTSLALRDKCWQQLVGNAYKRKVLHSIGKNYKLRLPKRVQT